MRAAIVLVGSLLVVSSAFAGETQLAEGSLEKFGATGLQQVVVVAKTSTSQATSKTARIVKETQVSEGSLEKFGATGLSQ
ncbi:MAG TPA: hypothetical protein VIW78_10875 [Burkholderiales bacterium]